MTTRETLPPSDPIDAVAAQHRETARRALEEVCSGRDLAGIDDVYGSRFVDHVNALEYHGTDGARRSVALYLKLFPDLRFEVEEQVTEGDRVASRSTLHGAHRGRTVQLRGIVISRFEDGKIVEDWAASDTLELARQSLAAHGTLVLLDVALAAAQVKSEPQPGRGGEPGDDSDGSAEAERIGDRARDQAARGVPHIAPEAIHPNRWCPRDRCDGVGDSGDQSRIHERCAYAEHDSCDYRQREATVGKRKQS